MNYFADILKQFNSKQKVFILVILLFFTSITSIITNYLTSDYNSCEKIVRENRELLEDYIVISNLLKKQYVVSQVDSMATESPQSDSSIIVIEEPEKTVEDITMDSIMKIVSRHTK